MRHKLLVRQLRRSLGVASERDLQARLQALRERGDAELADGIDAILASIGQVYEQYDRDLRVRTRMLEISSEELTRANAQLHESARDRLAAAEAAHRRILNSLREVVFQTDPAGNWVYLNPAWENITGFALADTLGQRALHYIHPEDQQANLDGINALIGRDEQYFRNLMRFRHADGSYRWLEVFARRLEDDAGKLAGLSGSLIDITEQKLAQDRLNVSEQRLNQALRATDSHLWDWDLSQPQPYVDPAWMISLGYSVEDGEAVAWEQQLHPEDLQRWRSFVREHVRRERPELDMEVRFRTAAGDWRYTALRGKVVAWDDARALRMAGTLQDIGRRKQAEAEAARQKELTEQILDQLPISIFLKDRSGTFVRFNRMFQFYSRLPREAMLGKRVADFTRPEWAAMTVEEDEEAWNTGRMVTSERRLMNVDPPVDMLVNRIVITSGGESYLLGFSIDISEQRAARDAMQRAVEAAEASSRAKSDFLANMSHEIRTPMNGILGMTELLLQSELSPEQREDLVLVKASADSLLVIINDILDFSKIEAGKLDIEEVPFDLAKLALDAVRSMSLRAQQKSLELDLDLPTNLPRTVKGDPGRLRQVLLNLLNNAIKFTEHGKVVLALSSGREEDGRCEVTFAVTDTGIGIPQEKQRLIFEAFSQVDGSTTREYGGTGLGLTICRRLVILMNGQMHLVSEPGKGSTFSVTIPLRQTGVSLMAPVATGSDTLAAQLAVPPTRTAGADTQRGMRILLAEDNPVNQRLAVRLLEKMGHHITLVDNGLAALDQVAQDSFDLVLLDVQMPGLDGLSVTRQIRAVEASTGAHLPIIAMTARAMQGDRERCLEAGMDDYLSKPIDAERLRQVVSQFDPRQRGPLLEWRNALQRLDGDTGLFLELASIFIDDGPALLDALRAAIDAGDLPASQRAAHSLKGVLVNFGASEAVAQAEQLSASLHDSAQASTWRAQADALAPTLDEVYSELRALIESGPAALQP